MTKITFLGLGIMGFPMAGHLAQQGYHVTAWNRSPEKTKKWQQTYPQGYIATTIKEAVKNADIIFTCLGNDNSLEEVMLSPQGIFAHAPQGAYIVDHTTASHTIAIKLEQQAQQHNLHFIDAPVSGGEAGAQKGTLTIMCGASEDHFNVILPIIQAYGKTITHIGPVGTGQLCKMVNQICIAGIIQSLAEGLHFAKRAHLDLDKVIPAISGGSASSWQMIERHSWMTKGIFENNKGFPVEWMHKDLNICLDQAQKMQANLTMTETINQYYQDIIKNGGARWDTSSLITRLEQ